MRLRIFGIPKILLLLLGFLPALLWCVFHMNLLSYHEKDAATILGGGLIISGLFTYLFGRGFFSVRFAILIITALVFVDAFITSIAERDFPRLALVLAGFGVTVFMFFWLESRSQAADINPKLQWFEGKPKLLPEIKARLKIGDEWVTGQVRAIDKRGFFVFLGDKVARPSNGTVAFELSFKNTEVQGQSRMNAYFYGEAAGFGLQFLPKDLYHFSQYTALVERLKGEGL